jgi:hypothetical protein
MSKPTAAGRVTPAPAAILRGEKVSVRVALTANDDFFQSRKRRLQSSPNAL